MLKQYEAVSYELLRPEQVKAIRSETPIAYVPAGSLEWHGRQNPLGTDSLKAHAVCCTAALKYGGVVLPPFYQGLLGDKNWGPDGWDGYTLGFNQESTLEAAMLGIVKSLVAGGWKVIVGVTGHDVDVQRDAIGRAIKAGTAGTESCGFALKEGELHTRDDDLPYGMDHAGAWETSCMMYACGEKVDLDQLRQLEPLSDPEHLEMKGPEGIGGKNPLKYASPELGEKIITRMGKLIGQKAKQMLDGMG